MKASHRRKNSSKKTTDAVHCQCFAEPRRLAEDRDDWTAVANQSTDLALRRTVVTCSQLKDVRTCVDEFVHTAVEWRAEGGMFL